MAVPGHSEIVDYIVAVVNGEAITFSAVEDSMNTIWGDQERAPKTRKDALENLVDRKLELQEARRLGVIVSEERLSHEAAKVASYFASPEKFSEALQRRGIAQRDVEETLIEEVMIQEMVHRKFRLFAEVTDLETSDFFEKHREEFMMPESVHLGQAFFQFAPDADKTAKETARGKAEELLETLKDGADFAEYVTEDGVADYIPVDQMIPVVAAAAAALEVGEISDIIETPIGYFVVKMNDRRPTRQAALHEVGEEIRARLIKQKTDVERKDWLVRQRELADIRVNVEIKDQ